MLTLSNRKTKLLNIYLYVHMYSFLLTSTLAVSIIDNGQVQVELCPWNSCINCYCISNGKMWKDSTQIFLSYLSCAEATWYHTKMLTINLPKHMGQPVWSLIYAAFSDFYFVELFNLSCDHMSLFRLNYVACWSLLLCFFYWIPQDLLKYIKYLH